MSGAQGTVSAKTLCGQGFPEVVNQRWGLGVTNGHTLLRRPDGCGVFAKVRDGLERAGMGGGTPNSMEIGQAHLLGDGSQLCSFITSSLRTWEGKCPETPQGPCQGEGFEGSRWMCTHKYEAVRLYINHTNCLHKEKSSVPFEMSQEWPCTSSHMVHAPEGSILLCAWAIHFGPDKRRTLH